MMHSGYILDTFSNVSQSFQFKPPEKKYWTDVWKGWYHCAYRQQADLPFVDQLRRERQQKPLEIRQSPMAWQIHGDVEVGLVTLIYRFRPAPEVLEPFRLHSLVVVLGRKPF